MRRLGTLLVICPSLAAVGFVGPAGTWFSSTGPLTVDGTIEITDGKATLSLDIRRWTREAKVRRHGR